MESGEPGNGKLQVRGSLPGKVTKDSERTLGCLGEEPWGVWGRSHKCLGEESQVSGGGARE